MNLFLIFIFLVLLILSVIIHSDYLNPFKLFVISWSVQVVMCLLLFGNSVYWSYGGLEYIFAISLIFFLLSFKYKSKFKKFVVKKQEFLVNRKKKNVALIILIFFGIVYSITLIQNYGLSLKNFTSLDLLLQMNNYMAIQRYTGNVSTSLLNRVLLIFVYAAPMCGGYSYIYSKKRIDKVISLLTLLPVLFILLIENTKAPVIACVIFFLIAMFTAYLVKNEAVPKINFKKMSKWLALFFIIFSLLFVSMMFRIGKFDISTFEIVKVKIGNYIFGHIPAFDHWFSSNCNDLPYSFGIQTFISIFDTLGIQNRIQGVYAESYVGGALGSNVYTYLRGLISDFGIIGSLLFLISFLGITNYNYQRIKAGSKKIISQIVIMVNYSFILFFFVSIFSYTSFVIAFVIYGIFLRFIREKEDKVEKSN